MGRKSFRSSLNRLSGAVPPNSGWKPIVEHGLTHLFAQIRGYVSQLLEGQIADSLQQLLESEKATEQLCRVTSS